MMEQKNNVDAILFHIEHSKPIEISEFVTSLNAIGNLFSLFAKKNGDCKEAAKSKLYVEKIDEYRGRVRELTEKNTELMIKNNALEFRKCNKHGCSDREPPSEF